MNRLLRSLVRRHSSTFHRNFSSSTSPACPVLKIEHLQQRQMIFLAGDETSQFLQGLVTNDMSHLERGNTAMYALFLNKGGRVMYDTIIYKEKNAKEGSFYVEVDAEVADQVVKHLKLYRVRRKIEIEKTENKKVWVVFDDDTEKKSKSIVLPKKNVETGICCTDPRLKNLGTRLILDSNVGIDDIKSLFDVPEMVESNENDYRKHRYRLGIGEGVQDLPQGKAFPLEANVDYLNGVSFHKGCYVGQELTARTHHTGVVRKRLMPLTFKTTLPNLLEPQTIDILNESEQNVGKLRGYCNGNGLALLRIEPALAAKKLFANGIEVETRKPAWWPQNDDSSKHIR
ncbi:putative transferase CAF17 homolog, mitochondrial [Culicoides brevitarsis]|uniref:putative transferase CAF17 homolog, mitochondrial n=1 Tax=Culicoides brevitarsis TaxID=469753 RepID=UPI00307CBB09